MRGRCGSGLAVLFCFAGLTGCGGVSDSAVVVKVGGQSITKATVDHWASVIGKGGAFDGFRGGPARGTPRRRALTLLISSHWLLGEAARQGVGVSESDLEQAFASRYGGSGELQRRLHATGQTLADVKLELSAELDAEAIREKFAQRAARITPQEVVAFYHDNIDLFHAQDRRTVDVISHLPTAPAATALVKRIGAGRHFARMAERLNVPRLPDSDRTPEDAKAADAMFATPIGVVGGPVRYEHSWIVFVARSEIPGARESLAEVRAEVLARLDLIHQHALQASYDSEFKAWWTARTSCRAGYVAPGCPQFRGSLGAYEDPFSRRAHPLFSELGTTG